MKACLLAFKGWRVGSCLKSYPTLAKTLWKWENRDVDDSWGVPNHQVSDYVVFVDWSSVPNQRSAGGKIIWEEFYKAHPMLSRTTLTEKGRRCLGKARVRGSWGGGGRPRHGGFVRCPRGRGWAWGPGRAFPSPPLPMHAGREKFRSCLEGTKAWFGAGWTGQDFEAKPACSGDRQGFLLARRRPEQASPPPSPPRRRRRGPCVTGGDGAAATGEDAAGAEGGSNAQAPPSPAWMLSQGTQEKKISNL